MVKTDCEICAAFNPTDYKDAKHPPVHKFEAIWDTGATHSVITQKVVETCGLSPIGMAKVHGYNSISDSEVFLVNIILPNKVGFHNIRVTLGKLTLPDVLIGMDILTRGDLALSNVGGNTVFSFRFPSLQEVDFVRQIGEARKHGGGGTKTGNRAPKPRRKNRHRH